MEVVILDKLYDQESCYKAIEWALQQRGEYPERPKKPILSTKHTSLEAKQYSIDLQAWEKEKQEYDERVVVWKANENAITDVIVTYIKDLAGFNFVPIKYQDKVYAKAYQDGHSDGYYEVYQKLISLVEIFR